jgi:ABC-type glycerol-3-phosphate transport system substrate-binding protein
MRRLICCVCLSAVLITSCIGNRTAEIWTDRPEFALYGEYFNASQNQYKVIIKYFESPAAELGKTGRERITKYPDIIVASWLKNESTGTHFRSLDYMMGAKKLSRTIFYPRLLAVGRIDRNQYLLPVSYNIPALIFKKDIENELSNTFTIGFDEIKQLSKEYNAETRGSYTRMGFSPLWDDNFLMLTAVLYGASFMEASPLAWNAETLDSAMRFIYNWTYEINKDNQAEEDFTFKYFFEPPERLIQGGRILFSYMESNALFTLSEESRNALDFRWIMENSKIPINENAVFLGMPKRATSLKASRAFIQWFFRVESQRQLLEYSRANRVNEIVFGICDGFSAIVPVTEQIFPRYYTNLLGRMPPSEYLTAPNLLPANWAEIKERVVMPYLNERARKSSEEEAYSLEKRLLDWQRLNR